MDKPRHGLLKAKRAAREFAAEAGFQLCLFLVAAALAVLAMPLALLGAVWSLAVPGALGFSAAGVCVGLGAMFVERR